MVTTVASGRIQPSLNCRALFTPLQMASAARGRAAPQSVGLQVGPGREMHPFVGVCGDKSCEIVRPIERGRFVARIAQLGAQLGVFETCADGRVELAED